MAQEKKQSIEQAHDNHLGHDLKILATVVIILIIILTGLSLIDRQTGFLTNLATKLMVQQ